MIMEINFPDERKPHLEYLAARERLMEEIKFIILSEESCSDLDELLERLCDAVCKHFPTTAQDSIQSCWIPKEDAES